jgi:demethylmenaquinone methyltransferase / 2-methoxy-6-polyprenyl-1,4-benzoquinol methylase
VPAPDVSKSPRRIAGMFDRIAARYDLLNHLLSLGIDRRWRARAVGALHLAGGEIVLDLCTGTGDLAVALLGPSARARRVVGVDFSSEMLAVARAKLRQRGLSERVGLVRGDATDIPLADRAVDAITIGFGIRNVEAVGAACAEALRVLVPGGRLAVLEFGIPAVPLLGRAYAWYLHRVLPKIGRLVSGDTSAYAYLPASIDAFASPDEFVKILRHAGFVDARADPLTLGTVILYTARRAG